MLSLCVCRLARTDAREITHPGPGPTRVACCYLPRRSHASSPATIPPRRAPSSPAALLPLWPQHLLQPACCSEGAVNAHRTVGGTAGPSGPAVQPHRHLRTGLAHLQAL